MNEGALGAGSLFTTKDEGLGLGLTICRKTIEAHGGQLSGRTNAGHGATFTFTLPLGGPIDS
jgi:signal transduction histidine kinase